MTTTKIDRYLGDVQTAFERLDMYCPNRADVTIRTSDQQPHRYSVMLHNLFGRWEGCAETLAEGIHAALDTALDDSNFRIDR